MSDYEDLFHTDSVGKLPVMYHMRLDESVRPTVCAPRRILLTMKDKVLQELERMTKLGIISPVEEATSWVSAMAATVKKDGTAKVFSILDAKCGFWQIPLDEESSRLTTFMTPFGR
ncbi:Retrovirus-related Pol poly from transposon [Labeo rohita]|uniref:Retrovirus-related Pol poly from transposon n=1 Tax=Labeo rohita TaxID=84645 RepID=A0A498NMN4_LABRO|nr:Retrovirus-related Pol poly from transposon [Labeo rohita]